MKKLLSIFTAVIIAATSYAQVPANGGFENWTSGTDYDNPNNWWSTNEMLSGFADMGVPVDKFGVEKSTDAHSGSYAAKVQVAEIMGGAQIFPGIMALTNITEDESESGIPFTERPDSVYVWLKYDLQGNDSLVFAVLLTVWDAVGDSSKEIGNAGGIYTGSQSSYIQLALPVEYDFPDTPDSLQIAVMVGQPDEGTATAGSYVIVDDIRLTGVSAPALPAAPSNLTTSIFKAASTGIRLDWQDNSNDETAFIIERGTAVSGPFNSVGSVAANTTTFDDTDVTDGTTYYYRVLAENANGTSAPSNVANGTAIVTGIDAVIEKAVALYPNPNNGIFNTTLPSELQNSRVAVYNITGQEIYSTVIDGTTASININAVSGSYFLKIQNEKYTVNKRLIVE